MQVGTLDEMRNKQSKSVPAGTNCQKFLNDSFESLFSVAKRLSILDRFAVTDALRADSHAPGSSGLQQLVTLAAKGGVEHLEMAVSIGGSVAGKVLTAAELVASLSTLLAPYRGAMSIEVFVTSKSHGASKLHDRWIGVSWGGSGVLSWTLGKGLVQFDGATTLNTHAMARQDDGRVVQLIHEIGACSLLTVSI
jgi:hypothetical protein